VDGVWVDDGLEANEGDNDNGEWCMCTYLGEQQKEFRGT